MKKAEKEKLLEVLNYVNEKATEAESNNEEVMHALTDVWCKIKKQFRIKVPGDV